MHARLLCPKNLLFVQQIEIESNFPCSSDEIAEPRQDVNIRVAAFTVSEKCVNMTILFCLRRSRRKHLCRNSDTLYLVVYLYNILLA